MRIISQNNKGNYPYDLITILRNQNEIYARTITGREYLIARYSTEEKAEHVFSKILINTYNVYGDSYKLPKDESVKLNDEE